MTPCNSPIRSNGPAKIRNELARVLEEFVTDRLLSVHRALQRSGLPYAFGGAIALGYCVREPRGTTDLDVNVFVPAGSGSEVLAALPSQIPYSEKDRALLVSDGQVRLRWGDTPVDIFLMTDPFHEEAAAAIRVVPFIDGVDIPVLACQHLAVFKTFYARPKDFIDISNMVENRSFDVGEVRAVIEELLGADAVELTQFDAAAAYGRDAHLNPDRDEPRNQFPRR